MTETTSNITVILHDGPLPPCSVPRTSGAGAELCFEGIVRPLEDERAIAGLSYEIYEPMATNMLTQLARQIVETFGLLAVRVEHSRGFVAVGECSFRLCISSAHRGEGLAGMGLFIDQMKQDVPIWKTPVQQAGGAS